MAFLKKLFLIIFTSTITLFAYANNQNNLESEFNSKSLINCIDLEFVENIFIDSSLLVMLENNCENADQNVWKVTIRSDGSWECETGQSYKCFPCKPDDDK